ncbi:MAG: lipopolysaccharide core heptose(II) kinase RfaY [Polaribacter sp.]
MKDKNVNLIKVYDFYELDKVQIIIFDFFESSNLNEKHLISNPEHIINEINNTINILSQNNISHRDIKLDNFLFKDNKIFIIDFSFAINIKDKKENLLLELKRSKKNIKTLKNLGINIKNDAFIIWNDYYSMKIILIKIQEKYKLNNLIINKSIILFDSLMLNNNYYYRL